MISLHFSPPAQEILPQQEEAGKVYDLEDLDEMGEDEVDQGAIELKVATTSKLSISYDV